MSALVTLKVDDDEKALWVESAQHAGVSLSEWIRQRCKAVRMTDVNVTVWPNPSDSGVKVEKTTGGCDEIVDPISDADLVRRIKKHTRPIERAVERAFTPDFKQGKKK